MVSRGAGRLLRELCERLSSRRDWPLLSVARRRVCWLPLWSRESRDLSVSLDSPARLPLLSLSRWRCLESRERERDREREREPLLPSRSSGDCLFLGGVRLCSGDRPRLPTTVTASHTHAVYTQAPIHTHKHTHTHAHLKKQSNLRSMRANTRRCKHLNPMQR